MEDLTFKLDGIVKGKTEQENFEGPLTLILQLLTKNRIEIRDIQISLILDQYLDYLDRMEKMDLEIASEFVTMAAHLVYIKTRMLLDSKKEIDELEQLISSLETLKCREVYLQIKSVTAQFNDLYRNGSQLCVKQPELLPKQQGYKYTHDKTELSEAIYRVLSRGENGSGLISAAGVVMPKAIIYPVAEKSDEILNVLKLSGSLKIVELFRNVKSRTELVAAFLSILELCKNGGILLVGTDDELMLTTQEGNINVGNE